MSRPPPFTHSHRQSVIAALLFELLPDGLALPACPVSTAAGVKAIDVAWLAADRPESRAEAILLTEAPEICVEILSPSNSSAEINEKRALSFDAGAKEVWLCDRNNPMTFFAAEGQLERSGLCPDFPLEIDLEQQPINKLQEQLVAAYDQLVKTPEDRTRLEKTNPELVAARDRIVTAQKRALLARETTRACARRKERARRVLFLALYPADLSVRLGKLAANRNRVGFCRLLRLCTFFFSSTLAHSSCSQR